MDQTLREGAEETKTAASTNEAAELLASRANGAANGAAALALGAAAMRPP